MTKKTTRHSKEKDDGTVAFMAKWAEKRSYCEIYEYPYNIIPPHHNDYKNVYNHHNSLAVCNRHLVKYKSTPINGLSGDSYFIKRKHIDSYI